MDENSKYMKYKQKYLNLRKKYVNLQREYRFQHGGDGDNTKIIDLIELYNKAFNSYIVYRFRFDNTKPIITSLSDGSMLTDLSNLVSLKMADQTVKDVFSKYYHSNITDVTGEYELLFTLRQQTTSVIKDLLLKDKESIKKIGELKQKLIGKKDKILNVENYKELLTKCEMIEGLVKSGISKDIGENPPDNLDPMDIIRWKTNKIILLIGDEFDNNTGQVPCNVNDKLDQLFRDCFSSIWNSLKVA
jgi:hypothetical protein